MPFKWTSRSFNFDFPEGLMPNMLERLFSTSLRLKKMTDQLSDKGFENQVDGKWSIKQHIGHLIDLEALHEGRLDDFLERREVLRAADMKNKKTEEADHNNRKVEDLIADFEKERSRFISRLRSLDEETQYFRSSHPRLAIMMRPVDVAYFTAEHDDHHLVCIREIMERSK